MERRYSAASRSFLAFTGIVAALFIHIGVSLYAGAILCKNFFGVPILASILAVSFLTAIYTLAGGLRAVVVTEVVQTVILLLGSVIIFVAGLAELQARDITTLEQLRHAASTDGVDRMSMVHSSKTDKDYPFYTFIFGYPVLGVWVRRTFVCCYWDVSSFSLCVFGCCCCRCRCRCRCLPLFVHRSFPLSPSAQQPACSVACGLCCALAHQ